jgi:MFS family permease
MNLGDNARICTLTEPLWAIPYFLFAPFVSVYMSELGLSDAVIGIVGTIYLISQVVFSLLSGVLADKLGRRLCTFLFDMLSWSLPTLLWALAQDVWWFVAAAIFNGSMRVTANSWQLLLIEDEDAGVLVKLYALINISANLSAFAVLLSYPMVRQFGLVPTVRGMYAFAFVSMTVKFFILYKWGHETRIGNRRMEETRGLSVWSALKENMTMLRPMLRSPKVMWTIGLLACFTGSKMLTDTFWPLLVADRMGIPKESLAFFAAVRSAIMLICFFVVSPRISVDRFKRPLTICFAVQIASKLLLVSAPSGALWLLWVTLAMDAFSFTMLNPLTDSLQMLSMDPHRRAQMLGLFFAIMLLITSPLGTVGGLLSDVNRALPLVLASALCALAIWIGQKISLEWD